VWDIPSICHTGLRMLDFTYLLVIDARGLYMAEERLRLNEFFDRYDARVSCEIGCLPHNGLLKAPIALRIPDEFIDNVSALTASIISIGFGPEEGNEKAEMLVVN